MRVTEREAMWQRLVAANQVTGALPAQDEVSPWYVRAMLGVAGWLAALFLMAFVGMALEWIWRSPPLSAAMGLGVCTAAAAVLRLRRGELPGQFAFAVSIAGQALFVSGVVHLFGSRSATAPLLAALLELALIIGAPSFLLRFTCTLGAAFAIGAVLAMWHATVLLPPLLAALFAGLWLADERWGARRAILEPVAYALGVATAMAGMLEVTSARSWIEGTLPAYPPRIGSLLVGVVMFALIFVLLRRAEVSAHSTAGRGSLAAGAAIALAGIWAPGLAAAILIVLVGHQVRSAWLVGLGIASLLGYLAWYYYSLELRLLVKSVVLAASGVILLLLRAGLLRSGARGGASPSSSARGSPGRAATAAGDEDA